ncbi:hypothetical protein Csa_006679 [Cucumis sativus]|uniref:Uncharacterized protein n=1 Tax=Cucumis sativus TaxID=3659 RepID=A0A0A0LKU0_CUCSA|nr:hypothetical protein Csa_006679 [Cucumis sativus]
MVNHPTKSKEKAVYQRIQSFARRWALPKGSFVYIAMKTKLKLIYSTCFLSTVFSDWPNTISVAKDK